MEWKKQKWVVIAIIVGIVIFDQVAKYFAQTVLQYLPGQTYEFIPGFFNFTYAENTGMAFSMLSNMTWLLALLSGVLAIIMIWLLYKCRDMKTWLLKLSLSFIIGGAIGNLIDRVFRGYVVDMLEFDFNFAVFNVADSFVCIGAVLLGIFVIWFWDKGKKKEVGDEQQAD
ncbi:signal peptidase II [Christensenellaceae bacterium OttesenSCG-928-K19]|nr:signal peptidase II [Christensenellaceae bacterium OttesenSCG-928-K19]